MTRFSYPSPTTIDSWEGRFTETVAPGSFKRTLQNRRPLLLYSHGKHAAIGDLPVGAITKATEDARGLRIEARLHAAEIFAPIREAIASGALDKMSFRFESIREKWNASRTERTLLELRCPEVSIVAFLAYEGTSASVRDDFQRGSQMTREERMAAVRRLKAGLAGSPGKSSGARNVSSAKLAKRRVVAIAVLGYDPAKNPRDMTLEERVAHACRHGVYLDIDELRARSDGDLRNPYAAQVRRDQRESERRRDRRIKSMAILEEQRRRDQATRMTVAVLHDLRPAAPRATLPPGEEFRARVNRRKKWA